MTQAFLVTLLLIARIAFAGGSIELKRPQHVRNFGQVNDTILRGGMPTDAALKELKDLGVSLILDLRQDGQNSVHEKQIAEQLGMRYEHLPLRSTVAPTQDEIRKALSLLMAQASGKVYVHCLRGKDRTGTVVACYRIQHDGWNSQRALQEAKSYGMSRLEFGMEAFIRAFTPLKFP